MDLFKPVYLKGKPMSFSDYVNTIEKEQHSSLDYLKSQDFSWHIPESLKMKINHNGSFNPFFGDTLTMSVDSIAIETLDRIKNRLNIEYFRLFSEPLNPSDFHITLHDLTSSTNMEDIKDKIDNNKRKCIESFREISDYLKRYPESSSLTVISRMVYPSCNISIVSGFLPKTEYDYCIMMNLYNCFEEIVHLNYWLRPHVTLAYFRPYDLRGMQAADLCNTLISSSNIGIEMKLNIWDLAYQRFCDMNNYETLFTLRDFR